MFKSAADLVSAMDSNWLYLFPYYLPASRHVDIHYYIGFYDRLCVLAQFVYVIPLQIGRKNIDFTANRIRHKRKLLLVFMISQDTTKEIRNHIESRRF